MVFVFGIIPFVLLYEKADPVSSKSLYRCLRVLDVFVHLHYSKKDVFCQDFYSYTIHLRCDLQVIKFEKSKLFCELSDNIIVISTNLCYNAL